MYVHLFAIPENFPGISELRKGGDFVVGLVEAGGGVFGGLLCFFFFLPCYSLCCFLLNTKAVQTSEEKPQMPYSFCGLRRSN